MPNDSPADDVPPECLVVGGCASCPFKPLPPEPSIELLPPGQYFIALPDGDDITEGLVDALAPLLVEQHEREARGPDVIGPLINQLKG